MLTKAFWKGAGERALKTFLETFVPLYIAALGATSAGVLDAWTAPWLTALQSASGLALGATVLSLLVSLGNADFVAGGGNAEVDSSYMPSEIHTYYGAPSKGVPATLTHAPPTPGPLNGGAGAAPGVYDDEITKYEENTKE